MRAVASCRHSSSLTQERRASVGLVLLGAHGVRHQLVHVCGVLSAGTEEDAADGHTQP